MIEQDFRAALSTAAPITVLCGTRIFPLVLPETVTLPAIHYSFIGGSSVATFDGFGSQRYRVEVNCWGATYSDAVTLRAAVRRSISQTSCGAIQLIQFLQQTDFFDHELLQYRAMAEFYLYANVS